jgi:hypothetical protein
MSKLLVLELDDDADLTEVIHAIRAATDPPLHAIRVFVAIREDADRVLAVFTPDPQETP